VSEPFCDTCNRIRLSAVGQLHPCLALDDDSDLRTPLRAGASDDELARRIMTAVAGKQEGHRFTTCGGGGPRKHMVAIGG
jgi:GTP 3',8-cyclase